MMTFSFINDYANGAKKGFCLTGVTKRQKLKLPAKKK